MQKKVPVEETYFLEYTIGNELVNAHIIVGILFLSDEGLFLSMIP
jgi:hypothetical protein